MGGIFVCIVGPSGAGKDTLIAGARDALASDGRFRFPRRVVTRDASDAEDHHAVSPDRFERMELNGEFALSWGAHGLRYGIPGAVEDDLARQGVVVCNLSRRVIADAQRRFERTAVVLITAPREVLRTRILARGRETEADVDRRLDRDTAGGIPVDLTIRNVGPAETHAAELTRFLRSIGEGEAFGRDHRHRAG